ERAKIHKYVSGPLALFVLDKAWRYARRIRGLAHIEWVRFFPGQAVEVRIYGPSIRFRHGQHLRINCPSIAPLQWHPYSLTSDPADPDGYTFQLKVRGDWSLAFAQRLGAPEWFLEECRAEKARAEAETKKNKARRNKKIKKHMRFSRSKWEDDDSIAESVKVHAPHVTVHTDMSKPAYTTVRETHDMPKICIDGPYTGTLEYATNYKQVVLVAGGNGLNPMVSYLYAVVGQLKKQAANAKQTGSTEAPVPPKIDLIWVVRSKGCLS
ncbi:NADPH oxidase 4, partial [Linderina pennispora]